MTYSMDRDSDEFKEFLRYLQFCTHVAHFDYASSLPDDLAANGRAIVEEGEALFLLYRPESTQISEMIWITDQALYLAVSNNLPIRAAYEDIERIRLPFDDPKSAIQDPDLRKLTFTMKDNKQLDVPVSGITNGELDLFKLSYIVTKAQLALGVIPEPAND